MLRCPLRLVLLLSLVATTSAASNVLIVYANDEHNNTGQMAAAIAGGAAQQGEVRVMEVEYANYKRDVFEWADAVILGTGVYNGNPAPSLLSFINSFDFMDDLSGKVGSSFATGGGAVAGIQPVLESLNRGLMMFNLVVVGGSTWENSEGSGAVTSASTGVAASALTLATQQGSRVAQIAARLATPPPTPAGRITPPAFGTNWTASVSANLTQVGYDAGLVIVNFTSSCGNDPKKQMSKTVYGDSYTVLTRCDLGHEFTIAPASRGSACLARKIGRDVSSRICEACGCPFCVRDTNGTYSHGETSSSKTQWESSTTKIINGIQVDVWHGSAVSLDSTAENFALDTTVAFLADSKTPAFVNVTHPLWVQTAAAITNFMPSYTDGAFDIPTTCPPI